eukprot:3936864-Pyramimonas_sp.AAC.1
MERQICLSGRPTSAIDVGQRRPAWNWHWSRIVTRRVESQFRREWRFGFTFSSVVFQSAVDMARS